MFLTIAQVIAALFAGIVIVKSFDDFRRGRAPLPIFLFWTFSWIGVLIVAFFPKLTDIFQERFLGPEAGIGTIFGIAIIFLLFVSYRIFLKADRAEQDLNRLISELALRDQQKETKL